MNADSDDGDEDGDFYRDLKQAKNEKLGSPIPKEQVKESAQESEQEFLAAMKKTSEEFQAAKEALGSTGAVDLFLGKIQKEEQAEKKIQEHEDEEEVFPSHRNSCLLTTLPPREKIPNCFSFIG